MLFGIWSKLKSGFGITLHTPGQSLGWWSGKGKGVELSRGEAPGSPNQTRPDQTRPEAKLNIIIS